MIVQPIRLTLAICRHEAIKRTPQTPVSTQILEHRHVSVQRVRERAVVDVARDSVPRLLLDPPASQPVSYTNTLGPPCSVVNSSLCSFITSLRSGPLVLGGRRVGCGRFAFSTSPPLPPPTFPKSIAAHISFSTLATVPLYLAS
jgi:hypothetical protein